MTQLIHKTGNIFTSHAQGIGHGVNTRGAMGAGIALQFRDKFPDMYAEYDYLCSTGLLLPGETHIYPMGGGRFIYNIASQDLPGPNARYVWLLSGLVRAIEHAIENNVAVIALPRLGSNIGGLDEKRVEEIVKVAAESSPVDIELWTYDQ